VQGWRADGSCPGGWVRGLVATASRAGRR
jgi:hypothetical protein